MPLSKILRKITAVITCLTIFLLPFFFAPFLVNAYDLGKQLFLLVASFIIFCLWLTYSFLEKKLVWKRGGLFALVFVFFAAILASSLINPDNKIAALVSPMGPLSILLLVLVFTLVSSILEKEAIAYSLMASAGVLSLVTIVLFAMKNLPINLPSWNLSITKAWSPTGSLLSQAAFLFAVVPLGFGLVFNAIKKQKTGLAVLTFLANTINLAGLGIAFYLLGSIAKPILLPQSTAWAIAVESLKSFRLAALGVGPGQFGSAFNLFKPISFNNTEYWNLRFISSSNWYFQLLTEAGLIGLGIYLVLAWKILKETLQSLRQPKVEGLQLSVYFGLTILLVFQAFAPLNFFSLAIFFILLGLANNLKQPSMETDLAPLGNTVWIFTIFPLIIWSFLFYTSIRLGLANNYFLQSLKAITQNDGVKAYNLQIKAIQTNPYLSDYRLAYSQTNLALANSLATKKELSDSEKSTVSQLVQQSLREARAAVTNNPASAETWENLANTYRQLTGFAQDADKWAVASYEEAIKTDPLNPSLRIDLGGVYFGQKNYTMAINVLSQATSLKPDLANAHYNLANALREAGALEDAKREYEVTQSLVKIDSNDYQKVTAELDEVKKRLPAPTPAVKPSQTETLTIPETPKTSKVEVPVEPPPVVE